MTGTEDYISSRGNLYFLQLGGSVARDGRYEDRILPALKSGSIIGGQMNKLEVN